MSKLKDQLTEKMLGLSGVTKEVFEGKNGELISFVYKNKEFAHFHGVDIIDLRLTKRMIQAEGLQHPEDSKDHPTRSPKSPWIELQFTNQKELSAVFAHIKTAIQQIK